MRNLFRIFGIIMTVMALIWAGTGCSILSGLDEWVAEQKRLESDGENESLSQQSSSQSLSSSSGPERLRPDQVEIQWVDIDDDYEKNVPCVVSVRYLLESEDRAVIKVGFNTEEPDYYTIDPNARQDIRKGEGEYEFNLILEKQPEMWPDGTAFSVICVMAKTDGSGDMCSSRLELIESNVVPDKDEQPSSSRSSVSEIGEQVYYFVEDDNYLLGKESPYKPVIAIYEDNTFYFTANLLEGMGDMEGTYLIEGDVCIFTVTKIMFKGFTGDSVKSFKMTIKDNKLLFNDDINIGVTGKGSEFILADGKPESFVSPNDPLK